jgi:hypothetical protein
VTHTQNRPDRAPVRRRKSRSIGGRGVVRARNPKSLKWAFVAVVAFWALAKGILHAPDDPVLTPPASVTSTAPGAMP